MKALVFALALALPLAAGMQEEKKKEPFDPFANPHEELLKRADKSAKEKKYTELREAAAELAEVSRLMSEEIDRGSKEVISAKVWNNLDRAEKLLKTIRDKAK